MLLALAAPAGVSGEAPPAPGDGRVVRGELGARLDLWLTRASAYGFSGAAVIADGGEPVLLDGYGLADRASGRPFTATTVFGLGSLTKQFTAAAILALAEDGKLRLDDPLAKFFPDVPADKTAITLHHLLTHTSGLQTGFYRDHEAVSRAKIVRTALDSELSSPPGERWQYSNPGYSLLAAVIEIVAEKPYEEFLSARILTPAGMTRTGYVLPEWDGTTLARGYLRGEDQGPPPGIGLREDSWALKGNGGLASTAVDLLHWHRALGEKGLLSAESRRLFFAPHVPQPTGYGGHYGYGWFVDEGAGRVLHGGSNAVFSSEIVRDLATGRLFFVASTVAEFPARNLRRKLERIATGEDPGAPPPAVAAVDDEALHRLAGRCELASGGELVIGPGTRGAALDVAAEGQRALDLLFAVSEEERARRAAIGERTAKIVAAASRGDFAPQHEAFGPSLPAEVLARVDAIWDKLRAQHGEYETFEPIGTWVEGSFTRVGIRLVFANGEEPQMYLWSGDRLVGLSRLEQLPRRPFQPVGPSEYATLDAASLALTRVRFTHGEDGARTLVFHTGKESAEVRCGDENQ